MLESRRKLLLSASILFGAGLLAFLSTGLVYYLISRDGVQDQDSSRTSQSSSTGQPTQPGVNEPPPIIEEPQPESVEGRYLLAGTIVWDRGVEHSSYKSDGMLDFAYPFARLDSYERSRYDAWLADLECPISEIDVPPELGETQFKFNCRPEFLPFAAQYFDIFNLSNNHSDNSGRDELMKTRHNLAQAEIQYFGDPDASFSEHTCEVIALPFRIIKSDGEILQPAYLPIAFCGWHYYFRLPLPGEIELMTEYAAVMPVFAFLHMGAEYQARADNQYQEQIARRLIDTGAEFVIGNNPHWVQNAEIYKDKLIVYSTGNFIFDQDFSEETKRSVSLDLQLSIQYSSLVEQWLSLGETCLVYQDDCLRMAQSLNLEKLDFEFRFEPIAGYLENNQQHRASPQLQEIIEERLNWPALFPGLNPENSQQFEQSGD